MNSSLILRITKAVGVNAIAFGLYLAVAKFLLATEANLSDRARSQTDRTGLDIMINDLWGQLLMAGGVAIAIATVATIAWLLIVAMNPPIGRLAARAKRTPWALLLLLSTAAAGLVCWWFLFASILNQNGDLSAPVPVEGSVLALLCGVIGYWLGTGFGAPSSCAEAVPGFGG